MLRRNAKEFAVGDRIFITFLQKLSLLDNLTGSAACTGAAAMFYIVNESLSILENAVLLGVPVPQKLTQALDVAKWTSNSEKEEPQNEKQDE